MESVLNWSSLLNTLLLFALATGVFVAFRNGKRQTVVTIQHETIEALQARVQTLEARQRDLEKENDHLKFVLDTIKEALSKEHIGITIDGDMVTISNSANKVRNTVRKRPVQPNPLALAAPLPISKQERKA